ncbi:hypothetical protein HLRTI_003136 [Halorhabdus tiamatea SARL4B]|uniref:Uncharacterized protein n=1 Tax=Halorhabdus tiamatea SARL4B TaxID=1033806 RepID=U2F3G2_9EURY|nr:hypothetical protein HLRTI_003136 [Halorhabdus tiamatea SARL4B]
MSDPKSDWDILPQEILEENAGMSPYEATCIWRLFVVGNSR